MEKWFLRNPKADIKKLAEELKISEFIARLLANRQVTETEDARCFIKPELKKLHNPKLMKDLEKGAAILREKIIEGKRIRIVGDYDVDGVISTYILYSALLRCGAQVDFDIPHRILDGYGINNNIINTAKEDGVDTIITCDNGISAVEQINHARQLGISVIITDHHEVAYDVEENGCKIYKKPFADAVIDIKQEDCPYPFKLLCGAGVAFKLIQVLYEYMSVPEDETYQFVEFVAIATVCDVVDLTGENRIFVKNGLEMLNKTQNMGLKALMCATGIEGKAISVYHIGFIIGPSINASGRLDCARRGLRLLLSDNRTEADKLALELYQLNNERKDMTSKAVEEINFMIMNSDIKNDKVFVIYKPGIHESIAGIIAGKIREKYNVPTIILTDAEHGIKGSGRSIEEYNMFEELLKCGELLVRFGGHPMAAGLSLEPANVDILRRYLNTATALTDEDLVQKVYIEMSLGIESINLDLASELAVLEPYGKGNPRPLFAEKGIGVFRAEVIGANKNVLKLKLRSQNNKFIDSIYFGDIQAFNAHIEGKFGEQALQAIYSGQKNSGVRLDIIYNIDVNEYQGFRSVQLVLQYFR